MLFEEFFAFESPLIVVKGLITLLQGSNDIGVQVDEVDEFVCRTSQDERLISTGDVLNRLDNIVVLS